MRYHLLNERGVKLSLSMITAARTSEANSQYAAEKIHEQVKSSIKQIKYMLRAHHNRNSFIITQGIDQKAH